MSKRIWILSLVWIASLICSACTQTAQATDDDHDSAVASIPPSATRVIPSPTHSSLEPTPTKPQPSATLRPTKTPLPSATASPTPLGCWAEGGDIQTDSLPTSLLRLPLDYRVYLPPCYDQQPERLYPVLYLIHGQSYNDDQWDRLGADEAADRLIAAGELPPFIIVMPRDRYGGQPSENNFARAVAEELVPAIDENYRTLSEREYRAVGGLSRGGGWSVHLAITRWDLFSALGGHSPAIFFDDAQRMRLYLDQIPPESMPRIYIDIGDKDRPEILRAALWFEELLNERGIPHEWYLFSGYHVEAYWQDHMETYLRWYTQAW